LKLQEHMRKAHQGHLLRQQSGFTLHTIRDDDEAVDEMLESFDENGDGVFSKAEVTEMVYSFLEDEEKEQSYKKLVWAAFFLIIVYALAIYGIILQANKVTKMEQPADSGTLRTRAWGNDDTLGDVVQTATVKSYASILDFPALPLETLREVQHLTVEVDNTPTSSFLMYKIIGFEKHSSTTLSLFTPVIGTSIEINKGLGTARIQTVGKAHREIIGLSARRNLLSVNLPRTFTWDKAKEMHRRNRRLDDTDYAMSSEHLGAGFDAGGFCQFLSDESTSATNSAEAYQIPVPSAGFCEDTPAGDRGAACLMSACSNLAETCFPKNGEFQMFYGGIGYNYPEAWTTNWLADATDSFTQRRRTTEKASGETLHQAAKHTESEGVDEEAPRRRMLGKKPPLWRNAVRS
jgi:hypothetical protein